MGAYDKAIADFQTAINYETSEPQLYSYLAQALLKTKKLSQASEQFEKSLRLNPDQPDVHEKLATIHYLKKSFEKSIVHLNPPKTKEMEDLCL